MSRGKSTRLPSAAPVFEYRGELYEGRPAALHLDSPDIDNAKITLLDEQHDPWRVLDADEPGLRPRTKAARELLAHALAALDEQIDAEVAKCQADEEQDAIDAAAAIKAASLDLAAVDVAPTHPDGFGGDDFNGPYKAQP